MFDLDKIDDHFPMSEYREGQREAIEFAAKAFNDGKKIVILECPTGSGKSPIGITLMDMVRKSYYLTVTKVLQDQLTKDFGETTTSVVKDKNAQIIELKGRNAYPCTFYRRNGQNLVDKKLWTPAVLNEYTSKRPNCSTGFCRTKWNRGDNEPKHVKKFKCDKCFPATQPRETQTKKIAKGDLSHLPPGLEFSTCPYYEQVFKSVFGSKIVMNFSSFLFQTTLTNRFNEPRDLMVIDECHNVEPELLDFVSLSINDAQLQRYGIFIPELSDPLAYAVFFEDAKVGEALVEIVKEARAEDNQRVEDEVSRVVKKYQLFMDHITGSESEWVCEYEEKKTSGGKVSYRTVTLRPVFAMQFPEELLFRHVDHILMMSATVLDVGVMCRSLGIDRKDVAAYRMKNRFPAEKRPIYYQPVGKLTGGKSKMGQWMPKVVKGVDKLMDKYPDNKGIIHTHNFAIMDGLLEKCKPSSKRRFLDQRKFRNKAEMLQHHAKQSNSVIVAPAMHEGIDLSGDLSRFQIICKMPYANCFDNEQLARRVEIDRKYYVWLTALKLVQSYGRSVRSIDDYADTYILDESYTRFSREAESMLPDWFLEAVIDV